MPAALQIRFEEPDLTVATFENALLWSFRGAVTLERIKRSLTVHQELAKAFPRGFAVMTIIGDAVPLSMPADARDLSAKITHDFQPHYCGVCEVIEGDGFRASFARSVTAGIRLVARSKCPSNGFSDTESAARWLAPLMASAGGEVSAKAIKAAADRVRAGRA